MKYTTPSIEVVTFNPQDAARIGMQWWLESNFDPRTYIAAPGFNLTPTRTFGEFDATVYGVPCTSVAGHAFDNMTPWPGVAVFTNPDNGDTAFYGVNDGQSC